MKYKYSKKVGNLQEAMPANAAPPQSRGSVARSRRPMPQQQAVPVPQAEVAEFDLDDMVMAQSAEVDARRRASGRRGGGQSFGGDTSVLAKPTSGAGSGLDTAGTTGGQTMFHYTVDDGQHVLMVRKDGTMEEIVGPKRIWKGGRKFRPMPHHVAHPGEFLIVRFRNGDQEHLAGPSDIWVDSRKHVSVEKEEALQLTTKESVVVYSRGKDNALERRIVHGPAMFVPTPGEWLHTFSWHGSQPTHDGGYIKVPNALVFQKLWLLPDQMYHDVMDVRTADDAVLTIRLMMFFELVDIQTMLETTHDPIGDFINAASSDIVDFVGRHDFDSFKRNTEKLNELGAYKQLVSRAEQCGYRINKVVYRGYGAPPNLQEMHDQAIESRTRLQLEKATEEQAQQLEDYKLDRELDRAAKNRGERSAEQDAELDLMRSRQQAELEADEQRRNFYRAQQQADAQLQQAVAAARNASYREHLGELSGMGVELTEYLTQNRADQVIELRGNGAATQTHVHLPNGDE